MDTNLGIEMCSSVRDFVEMWSLLTLRYWYGFKDIIVVQDAQLHVLDVLF